MVTMIPMLIILGGMMFFMTRSQKKQQKQRQELLNSMKAGDKIVTIGGLHGVIHEVNTDADTITIDCEGIYLEFDRNAIKGTTPGTVATTEETVTEETNGTEETVEVSETTEDKEKENQ